MMEQRGAWRDQFFYSQIGEQQVVALVQSREVGDLKAFGI